MAKLDAGWRRLVTEIGVEFDSDRALELFRQAGPEGRGQDGLPRPRLRARAGRQGAARVRRPGPQPREHRPHRRRLDGVRRRLRAAVRARGRRAPRRDDGRLPQLHQARADASPCSTRPAASICEPNDTPLDSPAPRHDLRAADADRQDLHGQRRLRASTPRDTIAMGEILFGGREAIEQTPALDLADQLQLAAALGRPDARGAVRVLRGRPARRAHAVHPDGRDVAGDDPGRAGAADRRGAVGHRAVAADPARLPGDLRLVPVQHRHAVGLADLRHAGVGHRAAVHRPDRAPLRAAVPLRRRADVLAGARRAGRLRGADDDAADVPRRRELGHALRRLARGRPGRRLREVHHRRRAAADAAGASSPRSRSTRTRSRSTRTRRSATAATSSAPMHTMERFRTCFYRPLLSSSENYERWMRNGGVDAAGPGRRRSTRRSSRSTSSRRSTTPSAPSSRSTSSAAAPSSATDPTPPATFTMEPLDVHVLSLFSAGRRRHRRTPMNCTYGMEDVRQPVSGRRRSVAVEQDPRSRSASGPRGRAPGLDVAAGGDQLAGSSPWSTRITSCSMIGPSSRSAVT